MDRIDASAPPSEGQKGTSARATGRAVFSRRSLLRTVAGVGAALALSNCGGTTTTGGIASTASAGTASSATVAASSVAVTASSSAASTSVTATPTSAAATSLATSASTSAAAASTTSAATTTASQTASSVSGAAAAPTASGSTVEFWHIWNSGPSRTWLLQALAALKSKDPQLTVAESAKDFFTFGEKVTAAVAAGTPPSVTMADAVTAPLRGVSGEDGPLDAYVARDNVKLADLVDYQVKMVSYQGKLWGLPFRPDTRVLYMNTTLLQGAGLDPTKPPATWDALWTAAAPLMKKDNSGAYTQVGFYPSLGNLWFWTMAFTDGADFVDANGVPTLNTPPILETLEWYVKWADQYGDAAMGAFNKALSTGPGKDPFMLEKLAFEVNTNDYGATLKQAAPHVQWSTALVPYKLREASWGAGFDLEMPKGGKNPDGSWELIKWLDLDPTMNQQSITLTNDLSAVKAINNAPAFTKDPVWKTVVASSLVTRAIPQVPAAHDWSNVFYTHVSSAIAGKEAPQDALAKAQAQVIGEYQTNSKK
jgi:multiple sugar transport system substrate-binding protein